MRQQNSRRSRDINGEEDRDARKSRHTLNVETSVIAYVFLALFLLLVAYFVYFMAFKSEDFINNPANPRVKGFEKLVVRGEIKAADGTVLARTVTRNGKEVREYPKGREYAHVVGYNSNGMSGIESDKSFYLLRSHSFIVNRIVNDLKNEKNPGDNAVTSLDTKLQDTAYNGMGYYQGAAVAIDCNTGGVLAMVSKPDFDPNTVTTNWKSLSSDENSALLNRATQGLYPPGSTFKVITALSYLKNGGKLSDTFDCQGSYTEDGYTIHCYGGEVHGKQTFKQAFGNSCNVAFSKVGLSLPNGALKSTAQEFLFNKKIPSDISNINKSQFTLKSSDSKALVMQTAIGQGTTLVTPLHMALISEAVANDGVIREPFVVDHIENDGGRLVRSHVDRSERICTRDEANTLKELMRYVVTNGTGRVVNSSSYEAYGKTGTAEFSSNKDEAHSWFIGFAKKGKKKIAVAVIMEKGGAGSSHAAPLAKQLFDAYLG